MEMGSVFLSGDDEIIVIDPMNEYFDIAQTYGGTVVNMSTYTDNYVNPLEMDVWSLDPNDSKGMIREKGEFMLFEDTAALPHMENSKAFSQILKDFLSEEDLERKAM